MPDFYDAKVGDKFLFKDFRSEFIVTVVRLTPTLIITESQYGGIEYRFYKKNGRELSDFEKGYIYRIE